MCCLTLIFEVIPTTTTSNLKSQQQGDEATPSTKKYNIDHFDHCDYYSVLRLRARMPRARLARTNVQKSISTIALFSRFLISEYYSYCNSSSLSSLAYPLLVSTLLNKFNHVLRFGSHATRRWSYAPPLCPGSHCLFVGVDLGGIFGRCGPHPYGHPFVFGSWSPIFSIIF